MPLKELSKRKRQRRSPKNDRSSRGKGIVDLNIRPSQKPLDLRLADLHTQVAWDPGKYREVDC